jgi:hypothetical protein
MLGLLDRFGDDGGFELHSGVRIETLDELLAVIQVLHSRLRLSGAGGYTITQLGSDRMWFGTSPVELVHRLAQSSERYEQERVQKLHHSEEFVFCDQTRVGLLLVAGRRLLSSGRLYGVTVELRMAGVPLDTAPLRSVATTLRLGWDEILPVAGPMVLDCTPRPLVEVHPIEYLEAADPRFQRFLGGAVVTNPFWASREPHSFGLELNRTSALVGVIGDWLSPTEQVSSFTLQHLRAVRFRAGVVVDAFLFHDEERRLGGSS